MEVEAEIDRLPMDLLAHIFVMVNSFTDLAQASCVCRKWKHGVKRSMGRRKNLSFAGRKMDDDSTARLVRHAYSLKELDISRSRWACHITDNGLYEISMAKCISNLTSISLWGMTGITDEGVVHLVSKANSLQHLNIGGTFITDESLFVIAESCPQLKSIVLWSCRHVTGNGLLILVNKCRKLESINVWGTRVPMDCFIALLTMHRFKKKQTYFSGKSASFHGVATLHDWSPAELQALVKGRNTVFRTLFKSKTLSSFSTYQVFIILKFLYSVISSSTYFTL